jgi:hypothetical protein
MPGALLPDPKKTHVSEKLPAGNGDGEDGSSSFVR